MKKLVTALGIGLLITTLAVPVFARGRGWGMGGHIMGNRGAGPGSCGQYDRGYGYSTDEQRGQRDQLGKRYYDETA
ncbi:MAG: hypothetical protein GWN86_21950, partial [Desulfobacterales bacterium]|nr:hypothetical protein [Desulfobacterales bacterium]